MAGNPNRSLRLGDIGANAPDEMDMGRRGARAACARHAVRRTGANRQPGARDARERPKRAGSPRSKSLPTTDMGGVEPFGFADGISQTDIRLGPRPHAGHEGRSRVHEPDRARRDPARLLQRIRLSGGVADTRGGRPKRCAPEVCRRRRGGPRPRPQRFLSRLSPTRSGRARLLALGRRGGEARRRRSAGARRGDGRPAHERRALARFRDGLALPGVDPGDRGVNGFRVRCRPGRPLLPDRGPYPPRQSPHRRRPSRRRGRNRQSARDARAHDPPSAGSDLLDPCRGRKTRPSGPICATRTTRSPRRASTASCAAAANMGRSSTVRGRSIPRRPTPRPGFSSSASTPTSPASSSSCRAPGSPTPSSPA